MPSNPPNADAGPVISGLAYCVGDDVSADDILAPEYLSFSLYDPEERRWLGAYAMASLADRLGPLVEVGAFKSPYSIIVAGVGFGRGSARIHSPVALAEAGVRCVVAGSFAPGFMRAAVNGGLLHCALFARSGQHARIQTGDRIHVDLGQCTLTTGESTTALAPVGVTREIVEAGGLAAYLKSNRASLE